MTLFFTVQIQQTFASVLKIHLSDIVQTNIRFRVSVVHQPTPCALVHQPTRVPTTPPLAPRSTDSTATAPRSSSKSERGIPSHQRNALCWFAGQHGGQSPRGGRKAPPVATRPHAIVWDELHKGPWQAVGCMPSQPHGSARDAFKQSASCTPNSLSQISGNAKSRKLNMFC